MLSSNTLFVADLPKETTYEDLSSFFQNHHFQYASLNNTKPTSIWAKVTLESPTWAMKAKNDLNGKLLFPKSSLSKTGKPVRICTYNSSKISPPTIKQSLLVKNLDPKMSQREFYEIFSTYGDIDSAKIEYDEQGTSKGYGYISYSSESSAENAKTNLHMKEYYGKPLEIVNLIPSRSKNITNNTLFVINFPLDFGEDDLKKLFEKYGDISYVSITKDSTGKSRGCALITFDKAEDSSKCIVDIKNNKIAFPGLQPLTVKYASNKKYRESKGNMLAIGNNYDLLKIQFSLCFSQEEITCEADLDKEIRLFIKVVMLQEYTPKDVLVDLNALSGVVTFDNRKSFNLYLTKYKEFCMVRVPSFECFPVVPIKEEEERVDNVSNFVSKPNGLYPNTEQRPPQPEVPQFKQFPPVLGNFPSQTMPVPAGRMFPNMMMLNHPQHIPRPPRNILRVNNDFTQNGKAPAMPVPMMFPGQNMFMHQMMQMKMFYEMRRNAMHVQQMGNANGRGVGIEQQHEVMNKECDNEEMLDEIAEKIFEIVREKYPDEASKITGMIREKGIQTMNMLLSKKEDLDNMIKQAYELIKENE